MKNENEKQSTSTNTQKKRGQKDAFFTKVVFLTVVFFRVDTGLLFAFFVFLFHFMALSFSPERRVIIALYNARRPIVRICQRHENNPQMIYWLQVLGSRIVVDQDCPLKKYEDLDVLASDYLVQGQTLSFSCVREAVVQIQTLHTVDLALLDLEPFLPRPSRDFCRDIVASLEIQERPRNKESNDTRNTMMKRVKLDDGKKRRIRKRRRGQRGRRRTRRRRVYRRS